MRKVILGVAITLDGYIEGPNGEYDWCMTDQDYGMTEFFKRIDSMFIGRKSYDVMTAAGDSGFPSLTEYVFSRTLNYVRPGAMLIRSNLADEVTRIKNSPGKDIWLFGGAELFNELLRLRLVDEIWLSVHPILLGSGKKLFAPGSANVSLKLVDVTTYSTGLVSLRYAL
jgi:dihydrofolate reductase